MGLSYSPLPTSRFDQAVISIVAPVNYADTVGLRISEDQKVFRRLMDLHHRLFGSHRFDRITSRTDDARLISFRFDRRQRAWREFPRRRGVMFAGDDFSLDLERLASQAINRLRRRNIHIRRVRFAG